LTQRLSSCRRLRLASTAVEGMPLFRNAKATNEGYLANLALFKP